MCVPTIIQTQTPARAALITSFRTELGVVTRKRGGLLTSMRTRGPGDLQFSETRPPRSTHIIHLKTGTQIKRRCVGPYGLSTRIRKTIRSSTRCRRQNTINLQRRSLERRIDFVAELGKLEFSKILAAGGRFFGFACRSGVGIRTPPYSSQT